MKYCIILFCCFFIFSCKEEVSHETLITENIDFFKLYDASCESWLEQKFACATDSCFSSSAVEIVGIDTSDASRYQVYTWSWNEHFLNKDGKVYSGNKKLLITRFTIDPSTRANRIIEVYIPNEALSILDQLTELSFPEKLIDTYFTKQTENTERLRIQALTKKATDKYQLFLANAYVTQKDVYIKDSQTIDSLNLNE